MRQAAAASGQRHEVCVRTGSQVSLFRLPRPASRIPSLAQTLQTRHNVSSQQRGLMEDHRMRIPNKFASSARRLPTGRGLRPRLHARWRSTRRVRLQLARRVLQTERRERVIQTLDSPTKISLMRTAAALVPASEFLGSLEPSARDQETARTHQHGARNRERLRISVQAPHSPQAIT